MLKHIDNWDIFKQSKVEVFSVSISISVWAETLHFDYSVHKK